MCTLGVVPLSGQAADLLEALALADQGAERAHHNGAFAVGGVLLGPNLELYAQSSNRTIHEGKSVDPTAHGERQLIDWYYEQPGLPPADQCTIVSSLDPCLMCTGALRATGFRVLTLSLHVGVGIYERLDEPLFRDVRETFGYFGIEGERAPAGCDVIVPADFARRSLDRFNSSQAEVLGRQGGGESAPLPQSPLPADALEGAAAALVGPDGTVLLRSAGETHRSPIRTAVMELVRAWAGRKPHWKQCTLVTRRGPGDDPLSWMELGAYGSGCGGPAPASLWPRWSYAHESVSQARLAEVLDSLPPIYAGLACGPWVKAGRNFAPFT